MSVLGVIIALLILHRFLFETAGILFEVEHYVDQRAVKVAPKCCS